MALRVNELADPAQLEEIRAALTSRFDSARGTSAARTRLISLTPIDRTGPTDRSDTSHGAPQFTATIYDEAAESASLLTLDAAGAELSRTPLGRQPRPSDEEFGDASAIVAADPRWRDLLASSKLDFYFPMPPMSVIDGCRAIHVGLMSPDLLAMQSGTNLIVAVILKENRAVEFAAHAPPTSSARAGTCGVVSSSCPHPSNTFSSFQIHWPAADPVWSFTVLRPSSSTPQPNASGVEIRNVYYKGHLVFVRAHVPILDVKYNDDVCGPYRDWLDSENCFNAPGTDVAAGIRMCSSAPQTFCESGSDSGTFSGTAIWDEGSSLWLATECDAGWYRYVMQWRFYLDGRVQPIFGYGGVANSCVCTAHHHHTYWRFDMGPDGLLVGDTVTGATQVSENINGAGWQDFTTETIATRPLANTANDIWRVINPNTGFGYEIHPGAEDGSASGDAFAKADAWVLNYRSSEMSDGRTIGDGSDASINIDPYANNESLTTGRVVFWYRGGAIHDVNDGSPEPCHMVGPMLVPIIRDGPPTGFITH